MLRMKFSRIAALVAALAVGQSLAGQAGAAMIININADAGLASNPAALAAFNAAAAEWSSRFSDNITVNITASLASLVNPNIIGQTSATLLLGSYDAVRNQMVADAADEASNAVVAFLPTASQFVGSIPQGFSLANAIALTSANAKALGFGVNVASDASITFNSQFAFDYDRSNGVGAGLVDFQTVAAHEIGHALGFISAVDTIDSSLAQGTRGQIVMNPLDLFRFSATPGQNPTNSATFTTSARSLVPGTAAIFDDLTTELAFSTGVFFGDGNQASHWKDDALTGSNLGIMDPTLGNGVFTPVGVNDLRALDLIGYDLIPAVTASVPEPGTLAAALVGLGLAAARLRRRAA